MNKLAEIENQMLRTELEEFAPGDTVKVSFRVHEGKKDKIQTFQGVCIQIRGSGPNRTFTLRKISQGVGIERIFPLHSPLIEKIQVIRYGKVRRAKLYYLREKVGKGRYVKERVVSKKDEAKQKKPRRAAKQEAESAEKEAIEEASEAVEDVTSKQSPPEASSKEATDAATQSGFQGVEEG